MSVYNPDKPFTSFFESLLAYLQTYVNENVYEIVPSYPSPEQIDKLLPLRKTIIHFDIDEPQSQFFGFGDNVVDYEYIEYDELTDTGAEVIETEARCHEILLDFGIWASIESGGPSARLAARELLDAILNGPSAKEAVMSVTDGVELLSFSGGRNITETINDIDVFRMVGIELRVRIYSRKRTEPGRIINEIDQAPELEIDGEPIE